MRTVKESAFGSLALLSKHSTSTCIHSAVALRAKRESYLLQIACAATYSTRLMIMDSERRHVAGRRRRITERVK